MSEDWIGETNCQHYGGILKTTHKICCNGLVTWKHVLKCEKIRRCYSPGCRKELCELYKEKKS